MRLVNGPTHLEGTVEVCFDGDGHWGSVCDNGWDDSDASVVCRQLGFSSTGNQLQHFNQILNFEGAVEGDTL